MIRLWLGIAIGLVCVPAVSAQTTKVSTDQAFEEVYSRFREGYKRADPQMVANLYTRDAFYLQPGRKIEQGHEHVLQAFSFLDSYKTRPTGPTIDFEILDRQVDGNLGWDIGYYRMNGEGKPITTADQPDGKFIVLWKRGADGQWRIFADGYSDVRRAETASAEDVSAQKAIVKAVNAYFEGIMNNDSAQLDIAFHPDAELSATLPNGRIYRSAYSEWRKFTKQPKSDPTGRINRIANVDIKGNAAVVTTVLDWPTVRYVDFLSLIKTGAEEWKIVSKIWHQQAKTPPSN